MEEYYEDQGQYEAEADFQAQQEAEDRGAYEAEMNARGEAEAQAGAQAEAEAERQRQELNTCPKCGGDLVYSNDLKKVFCTIESCQFGKQKLILVPDLSSRE